ncbi:MAG: acyltransferase [Bacteroidales bacterium]
MSAIPNSIKVEMGQIEREIFEPLSQEGFNSLAIKIFNYQARYCKPYAQYLSLLGLSPSNIEQIEQIPFLPIVLYKDHDIKSFDGKAEALFTSSATGGTTPSKHWVKSLELYRKSFIRSFELSLGSPQEWAIAALLPSYLERENSSLAYMVKELIALSNNSHSGFYLYNFKELQQNLTLLQQQGVKTLLIGVTFALLEFIEKFEIESPTLTVIETGGMKGRGREIERAQLHNRLLQSFRGATIGSEYGMAELLSQGWAVGGDLFTPPPWMRVAIRDLNNPFHYMKSGKEGGINIIDLANIYSCSFIESEDRGVAFGNSSFKVLGRIESAPLRGCNLLLED